MWSSCSSLLWTVVFFRSCVLKVSALETTTVNEMLDHVNCTPDKDDKVAIQRIRSHFLADSCPEGQESFCTWTGDTSASCYLTYLTFVSEHIVYKEATLASWAYNTNITDENLEKEKEATKISAAWEKEEWLTTLKNYRAPPGLDEVLKRKLWMIQVIGGAALSEEKFNTLQNVTLGMHRIYATGKVCPYSKQDCDIASEGMPLEGGVDERTIKDELEQKTDYDELLYYWKAWRDATGAKIRDMYLKNLELLKEIALANGFDDMGQLWRRNYENDNFLNEIETAWQDLKPFYQELHAYARHKLLEIYPNHVDFQSRSLIPAHLLGNMWAQSWAEKFELLKLSNGENVNLDEALKRKYSSVVQFFTEADKFFQDIGLEPLPKEFYERSLFVKPPERDVECHASAWDLGGSDVRVLMCAKFKFEDFNVVHHEMGHIQYYLLYANQSYIFRGGANPGFHEAVGDLMSLSVNTPTHLKKLGLYETPKNFNQTANDINFLLKKALDKVVFLPFAYVVDKYREEYQGVKAPVPRSELDFDAGSKYHIASNDPYVRNVLSMGTSKPPQDALEMFTGQREMSTAAMMEYFQPLRTVIQSISNRHTHTLHVFSLFLFLHLLLLTHAVITKELGAVRAVMPLTLDPREDRSTALASRVSGITARSAPSSLVMTASAA
ncbi:unnamed protein product [Cyprideis torosa]|uniref:Angiotensin-converting enzyme n=1 Tax=Cyprideis torosa TaxID=163714 RepID=A0A7R8ZQE9_9CRUS|nr:unnamed protein product [Cyprideis torosa]CAG0896210.1 unnamed protein product [Cyprideis torosa]